MKRVLVSLIAVLFCVGMANAATIVGGVHNIQAAPGQQIVITAADGDAVSGLVLNVQINDGGPSIGGTLAGPAITAIDIVADSSLIFSSNNSGQANTVPAGMFPQLVATGTTTAAGSVAALGDLAIVTLDATGFLGTSHVLELVFTMNGPSDFAGVGGAVSGLINVVVPEPVSALLLVAGLPFLRRRR